jgi:hypothetical protein
MTGFNNEGRHTSDKVGKALSKNYLQVSFLLHPGPEPPYPVVS